MSRTRNAIPQYSTACIDWERRILARESLITMPVLFPAEAKAGVRVFNSLALPDVPGRPVLAKAAPKWARDLVSVLLGSYDEASGVRHLQELLLLVSKKNGKSSCAGAGMLTALIRNPRELAEFVIAAPTIEAAGNSYSIVRGMIRADPELDALLHVQDNTKVITHRETQATLKILASDANVVAGKRVSGVLIDELWAFGKSPRSKDMLTELVGGLASRPEGFVWYCTTMSDQAPEGVWLEKLNYARAVRDGKLIDPKFLPVMYEYPRRMIDAREHLEPKYFYVTNPSLGACVSVDFLTRELGKAVAGGDAALASFTAKHLNVQPELWLHGDSWTGAAHWAKCGDPKLTLDLVIDRCEALVLADDEGGGDDLHGVGVLGRERISGRWLHWGHAWCKSGVLERHRQHAQRFRDFERDGDLTITDEPGADIQALCELGLRLKATGKLNVVALDPAGSADTVAALEACGIGEGLRAGVSQGWKLSGAIKSLERRLIEGTFAHCNQPLMAWCVGNARTGTSGNATVITKAISTGKIDPFVALLIAGFALSANLIRQRPPDYQLFFI